MRNDILRVNSSAGMLDRIKDLAESEQRWERRLRIYSSCLLVSTTAVSVTLSNIYISVKRLHYCNCVVIPCSPILYDSSSWLSAIELELTLA